MMVLPPNGWAGAMLCLVAMFLPAFLLVIGPLPFADELRRGISAQAMLRGLNAAVARGRVLRDRRTGADVVAVRRVK